MRLKSNRLRAPAGDILYTSWSDSSLHLLGAEQDHAIVRGPREPADIGIDTRRRRVAIPMPVAGVVQLWSLDSLERR